MKYIIVKTYGEEDHLDLEKKVNEKIKNGYEPIGGITVIKRAEYEYGPYWYFQAMIQKD